MKLRRLHLSNFRNISSLDITPSPSLSVIIGKNGSGKSSILESIYYLGFGRSFRTKKHESVIQTESNAFSVFSLANRDNGEEVKVGLQRDKSGGFTCSINGEHSTKLSDLVSLVPVQLFTPQSTDLVLGSPSERRRFCDWGLFHVEHDYSLLTSQFQSYLKHRNALLKQKANLSSSEYSYWEACFVQKAMELHSRRVDYVNALAPFFEQYINEFLPEYEVTISYYKGWEKDASLEESLVKKREYDVKIGHTSSGPHKADIRLKVNGLNAQELLSRGQLRMAVAALQLAQTALFNNQTSRKSVFLLDDVGAELDAEKRERFIDGLLRMDTQVFVTAIESSQLEFIAKYNEKRMFHVEHGSVKEE